MEFAETIEVDNRFRVEGPTGQRLMVRGIGAGRRVIASEDQGMWLRAALFARQIPRGTRSIGVIGGGFCCFQRAVCWANLDRLDSYEIDPGVCAYIREHWPRLKVIEGDWQDTLNRHYDVIVWDLDVTMKPEDLERLKQHAATVLSEV